MARQKPNGEDTAMAPARNAATNDDRPTLTVKTNDKGQIWSHIRQKWLVETPEERVRQAYVVVLHNEYGFNLDQMDEELHVTGRGAGKARADIAVWRTAPDEADRKPPLIVVECKAEDYSQGEH